MTVLQLDHLNLTVDDFEATVAWYGRLFGFELVEQGVHDGQPWGVIQSGDALLCIYQRPNRRVASIGEATERGLHRINHFALRIDDKARWEQLARQEQLQWSYPSPARYPHSTAWYINDPSGHQIEVAHWDEGRPVFG